MAHTSEIEKLERRYAENPKGRNFAPLADAYRKAGQLDQAVELCKSGLERHPDYVSAHIVYGRCLVDQRNDEGGEQVFRHVLELDPENVIAFKVLAEIAERGSRLGDAVDWLTKLLAADPMNGDAAEALARAKSRVAQASRSGTPVAPVAPVAPAPPPPARSAPAGPATPTARQSGAHTGPAAAPTARQSGAHAPPAAARAPTRSPAPPPPPPPQPTPEPEPMVMSDLVVEHPEEAPSAPLVETGLGGEGFETYDGVVNFESVRGAGLGADGIELQEEIVLNASPIEIEGLARTQYEGSGLFKVDEGAPGVAEEDDAPLVDLPLIMPEDVVAEPPPPAAPPPPVSRRPTPAPPPPPSPPPAPPPPPEHRPAAARMSDDDGAADTAALSRAQPVVTETMAELYMKQGHQEEALRVYQALQQQRPSDARLRAKVEALSGRRSGGQSARAFLQSVLATRLGATASGAAPLGLSDQLDSAFGVTPEPPGEPTRAAQDSITLDALFGEEPGAPTGSTSQVEPPAPPPSAPGPASSGGGFSFDEFFGSGGATGGGGDAAGAPPERRPPARGSGSRPRPGAEDEGDLDQFQSWLKGLKS
ncbi:MAG TPA: tetratricopeptide repeat protein [Gemmatimonadales bacterium]|nr:tetratricopeptide repeat protein [Gemmatimonadales bacterium]